MMPTTAIPAGAVWVGFPLGWVRPVLSDHVLNLAYNVLCGGTRLEDIDGCATTPRT